jgi:hypothetical protein
MSPSTEDRFDRNAGALAAEETLRMIALMPAPEGLEDRVKAGLGSSPRRAAVIAWPSSLAGSWMRGAAAAAIVVVVAGGGWGVYSHIQLAPVPAAAVEQQMPNGTGAFSTAGARHVPQTVEGPVVAAPVIEEKKQTAEKAWQDSHKRLQHEKKSSETRNGMSADKPPARDR